MNFLSTATRDDRSRIDRAKESRSRRTRSTRDQHDKQQSGEGDSEDGKSHADERRSPAPPLATIARPGLIKFGVLQQPSHRHGQAQDHLHRATLRPLAIQSCCSIRLRRTRRSVHPRSRTRSLVATRPPIALQPCLILVALPQRPARYSNNRREVASRISRIRRAAETEMMRNRLMTTR